MVKIDDTDRKILKILDENSRSTYTDIAQEVGVSEATVRNRVHCLEKHNIIKKYTVEFNPKDIGYDMVCILGLDVKPQYLLEAVDQIRDFDEVRWAAKSTGDHMVMAEIWARDTEELSKLISEKIGKIEGVMDMKPAILLEKKDKKSVSINPK